MSLCYVPTVGRLTLVIMKCRELKAKDINGYSGVCPSPPLPPLTQASRHRDVIACLPANFALLNYLHSIHVRDGAAGMYSDLKLIGGFQGIKYLQQLKENITNNVTDALNL